MKSAAELAAEQAAFWNGPGGEGWLAAYRRIERSIAGFSRELLAEAAPRPGEQAVDIGCGTGATTEELALGVGLRGRVLGLDISEALIAAARARDIANAEFVVGDAATHPLDAASLDLVFSRFGVMFFAEPVPAFRAFRRALKPSGRLVFLCWRTPQENPWGLVPVRAAQPFLPPLPRPGPEDPGQYSFGDRTRVERILGEAGFVEAVLRPLDQPVWLGATVAEVVENAGRFGPLARVFADASPEQVGKAQEAIARALGPHQSAAGVLLPGACWLVSAKPG